MSTDPVAQKDTAPSSNTRFIILLVVFGIMLGALWYDRKVARPAVEDAYARITKLNNDMNGSSNKEYVTDKVVRNELKREPIDQYTSGPYLIEVYGWRGGLPFKMHKYYAVYQNGTPLVFLKHYMNELDPKELEDAPIIIADANLPSTDVGSENEGSTPAPRSKGKRESKESSEPVSDKESESNEQVGDKTSATTNATESPKEPETDSNPEKAQGDE